MSLPTSTKHRLLLDYNRKRTNKYEGYMKKKTERMEKTGEKPFMHTDQYDTLDQECKALYKRLAEDHKNKDVRKKIVK
eukprot:CAMPEP_0197004376 /NCGR_PEP_ID=MMETSP1380-20130617/21880_1 /TAXON_ID=5936 /ORGANISM="Euplotes crassus, Strain CT5" /LENGTH=77 /DNA_ID=CAMNT_0042423143 /DNA_START=1 /DNA_END=234 /DNA_ORIENTATION=+